MMNPLLLLVTGLVGSVFAAQVLHASNLPAESELAFRSQSPTEITRTQFDELGPLVLSDVEEVNGVAVLAIATLGAAGAGAALTAMHEHKRSSNAATRDRLNALIGKESYPASRKEPVAVRVTAADSKLQRKLLRLLHEDRRAADRLLTQAEIKNPGKSANWYLEKVIFDLQRDRGRY
ncbi:MAG: hypothetical protein MUF49_14735 [Oculatellaceae cyanobacterium Prado106]|jgi:hypothetical protein|nr:hypothetical protein [Oculatellaceae cyanobacterium Prado106]